METLLTVKTVEFGEIEVREEDIITFVQPILGFDECRKFMLVEDKDFFPIQWLQSIEEAALIFPVVHPLHFGVTYTENASSINLEDIQIENIDNAVIYTLLVIPSDKIENASTNLRAPIIINPESKLAKQVVYEDADYPVRFFLFKGQDTNSFQGQNI